MGNDPEEHGIRAVIEGQSLCLYIDYDRPRLELLSIDGKIEYLERRFGFVVLGPLAILLDELDSHREGKDGEVSVLIVWGNVLMCAIEALGHFLTPWMVANAEAFQTFVTGFMDPSWKTRPRNPPPGVDSYTRWLWDSFRNGLTHGVYVKNGGFEKLGDRLYVETEDGLRVDPWALDVDFRGGVKKMFRALHRPDNYFRKTFIERFDWTYIKGER